MVCPFLLSGCKSTKGRRGEGGFTDALLVITGTMGAGKTAVLAEASDILSRRNIVHAGIDLDALGMAFLPSAEGSDAAMYENLRSVCANYSALGVTRFMVARAIEMKAQLQLCCDAIPAVETLVCRLTASIATMQQRVQTREPGISREDCVARVAILNDILVCAGLEDFAVVNENRSLTDVALEMLFKAGWISKMQPEERFDT